MIDAIHDDVIHVEMQQAIGLLNHGANEFRFRHFRAGRGNVDKSRHSRSPILHAENILRHGGCDQQPSAPHRAVKGMGSSSYKMAVITHTRTECSVYRRDVMLPHEAFYPLQAAIHPAAEGPPRLSDRPWHTNG
jgi:hypothetical protein